MNYVKQHKIHNEQHKLRANNIKYILDNINYIKQRNFVVVLGDVQSRH